MRLSKIATSFILILALLSSAGCLPPHLKKYAADEDPIAPIAPQNPGLIARKDLIAKNEVENENASESATENFEIPNAAQHQTIATPTPTIFHQGKDQYRILLPYDRVWDALVKVVLKNYTPQILSRENGVIATDWDTYYLNEKLFRNRLAIHLSRVNRSLCELNIVNRVEQSLDSLSSVPNFLPSDDGQNEALRILKNVALTLGQPLPVDGDPVNIKGTP